MRHMASLFAKVVSMPCLHHQWIREQQEGMSIPLNSYMMYVVVGCEEVRDLHARGLVRILLSTQVPDVMAAP